MNIDTLVREFETALLHVREAHYEYFLHDRTSSQGVQDSLEVLANVSERMRREADEQCES